MKSKTGDELSMVDLTDEQVKELLGYLYAAKKRVEAAKRDDAEIEKRKESLRLYIEDNYGTELKSYEARIKAAWAQVDARGLKYQLPEGVKR